MSDVHPEQKQEILDIPFVDRHQVEVLLEKASRDPDEQLKTHFIRGIFANLEGVLDALTDQEAPLKERLARLLQAAQAVEDLAMIHGYDGIETIAHNMARAVAAVDPREHDTLPELLALKVKMAVEAIQKVLSLSDELNERLIVDSTTSQISELDQYATASQASEETEITTKEETQETAPQEPALGEVAPEKAISAAEDTAVPPFEAPEMPPQVGFEAEKQPEEGPESESSSWPLADSLTGLLDEADEESTTAPALETTADAEIEIPEEPPEELSESDDEEDAVFDIKEASTLIALMSEADQGPGDTTLDLSEPEETAPAEPEPGHDGAAAQDLNTSSVPPSAVEDLFADVLRDEAKETLVQLNQLLSTKGKVKDELLENTRFVLESLRETAEKLRYQDVADCAAELLTLSSERVEAGSPLDEKTRELFTQASKALREFVEGSPSASTRIGLVVERLRGERTPESDEEALDDAIIMELQKKLTAHETQKSGGLKGKLKKIFGR